jgi:tetratricopeptide (TPR) repeat protein
MIIDHASMKRISRAWLIVMVGILTAGGCERGDDDAAAPPRTQPTPDADSVSARHYVGTAVCAGCHADEHAAWLDSHHHRAMQPATPATVLGDFDDATLSTASAAYRFHRTSDHHQVEIIEPGADAERFTVAYAFGVEPLQQYLLPTTDGRLQALTIAWDSRPADAGGQRWIDLYPDDVITPDDALHWSGPAFNWNHMCADCHSTAVRKAYDGQARTFATRYQEVTVGCEACHGPGSQHVDAFSGPASAVAPVSTMLTSLDTGTAELNACAPCHSRRTQLAEGFTPSADFLDHYLPALLEADLYFSDGQIHDEVFEYGSFLQSRMHAAGVTCSNCHDPHSARLRLPGNATCTQCHSPADHGDFATLSRKVYDSPEHHFHEPGTEAAQCVSCHMPARTYMRVDDRRDHSFRLPRPDLSERLGVPNACNGCHDDRSPGWAAEVVATRFGPERPAHFAPGFHAARQARASAERPLVDIADDRSQPAIVRATALSLMGPYDRVGSDSALQAGLRDPDPLVQLGAIAGSERWPPELRWQRVGPLLDAPRRAVRNEAARVLASVWAGLDAAAAARLQAGIDGYQETLQLHADRAEARTSLGTLEAALGRVDAAEAAFAEALRINPGYLPALLNLADLYRATGRDAVADAPLQQALASVPDSVAALTARGLWLVRQQRMPEALTLIERAWRIEPDRAATAYLYAVALNSTGDPAAALDVLDQALGHDPGHRQLLETALAFARDSGDPARAQAYQTALRRL